MQTMLAPHTSSFASLMKWIWNIRYKFDWQCFHTNVLEKVNITYCITLYFHNINNLINSDVNITNTNFIVHRVVIFHCRIKAEFKPFFKLQNSPFFTNFNPVFPQNYLPTKFYCNLNSWNIIQNKRCKLIKQLLFGLWRTECLTFCFWHKHHSKSLTVNISTW